MFPIRYVCHAGFLSRCVLLSMILTMSWYASGMIKPANAGSRPPLAWQFAPLNVDRNECVRRAYLSLVTEIQGRIKRTDYYVSLTNSAESVDIICIKIGKRKTVAFVTMTASGRNSFRRANRMTVQLIAVVKSGGPYE